MSNNLKPHGVGSLEEGQSVADGVALPRPGKTPFRVDATIFKPGSAGSFYHDRPETPCRNIPSPFYALQAQTFMPPESPQMLPVLNITHTLQSPYGFPATSEYHHGGKVASDNTHYISMKESNTSTPRAVSEQVVYTPRTTGPPPSFSEPTSAHGTKLFELAAPSPRFPIVPQGSNNNWIWSDVSGDRNLNSRLTKMATSGGNTMATPAGALVDSTYQPLRKRSMLIDNPRAIEMPEEVRLPANLQSNRNSVPLKRWLGLQIDTHAHEQQQNNSAEFEAGNGHVGMQSTGSSVEEPPYVMSTQTVATQALAPSAHQQNGATFQHPAEATAAREKAKFLAQIIRNGHAELGGDFFPPHVPHSRDYSSTSVGSSSVSPSVTGSGMQLNASRMPSGPDPVAQALTRNGKLTLDEAFQHVPFFEACRFARPAGWGVIKITDIPYGTTKPEVVALLGRNARIAHQPAGNPYFAIHIIMERSTAKSMDCYVELETAYEAQFAMKRFETSIMKGHRPRIGDRKVQMEICGQEALMKELFPKAKCVQWHGAQPVIHDPPPHERYSSGFQGFVGNEEMVMTVKFAEHPSRSRYALRHEQRVYESMISLISKYPWWATELYTLGERDLIFDAAIGVTRALIEHIRRGTTHGPVTVELLQELLSNALLCSGFSETQRAKFIDFTLNLVMPTIYVTPLAPEWAFEVLRCKANVSEDHVQYYVELLKRASTIGISLAERSARQINGGEISSFGHFMVSWTKERCTLTMSEAGRQEWAAVEASFHKAGIEILDAIPNTNLGCSKSFGFNLGDETIMFFNASAVLRSDDWKNLVEAFT